jgi:hypothetical protein
MTVVTIAGRRPSLGSIGRKMSHVPHREIRFGRRLSPCVLPLVLGLSSGCYDGEALMRHAHSAVLTATLAEVDLGEFVTTLPRDPESGIFTTINVHIFGTVTRSGLPAVTKQLRADEFRLRHELLAAVRRSTRDELADPALAKLRARILQVANRVLADAPIKEVGFYQLTIR